MTGIREMFSELSGDEPDWFQLAFCFERAQEALDEAKRDWKRRNPQSMRRYRRSWTERNAEYHRNWRAAHPANETQREKARARKQRWLAANRERQREHHRKWKEKARAA